MNGKAFLDTNVLVYAYDNRDPLKQAKAQKLISDGIRGDDLALSVQVLGEFFNVVTRRIPRPLTHEEVREVIDSISVLMVQDIDLAMVARAIETHKKYGIAYWDALIVSAAERAGCESIFSEDLNEGQTYHEILVRNPFKEGTALQ